MSVGWSGGDPEAGASGSLTLKEVYRLLKREIESSSLQTIEPDTFQKIASLLGSLQGQGYEGIEAKVRDRLAGLLADSVRLLMEARLHKLRSDVEPADYSRLTDEEKYILDGMSDYISRAEEVISATTKGRVKVLESAALKFRSKQIIVRFLKPLESFVGVDMNKYGPFRPEDVGTIPYENARSMIEGGIAVRVHASQ
jgi:DNA replication factor GINS